MPSRNPSRSSSRGRTRSRSNGPYADRTRTPSLDRRLPSITRSPQRSISPRSLSRSRTPSDRGRFNRRNDRPRSASLSRSRSPARGNARGEYRERSYSRGSTHPTTAPKSSKIVVEKLTKNVNEDHLREIFGSYGTIREVELPMNRQTMTNRGTAYILYASPTHSESAIAHMHEAQLDGAVIHVSVVLPRRKFSRSPPPARRGLPPSADRDRDLRPPPRVYPAPAYGAPSRGYRSPPPRRGNYGGYGGGRGGRDQDTYRPRTRTRSRSPRSRTRSIRGRSRSYDSRSRSRTPPRRRGGGGGGGGEGGGRRGGRRDSPPRGGRRESPRGGRRRSPSYSSYSSYSRSRSRSRGRYGGRR